MAIWYETPGPTPYYIYNALFASGKSAPIGQTASGNFERWSDSATDALLNEYNSTADLGQQKQDMYGIEKIVVEQVPVIFLVNEPYWYEYNTREVCRLARPRQPRMPSRHRTSIRMTRSCC